MVTGADVARGCASKSSPTQVIIGCTIVAIVLSLLGIVCYRQLFYEPPPIDIPTAEQIREQRRVKYSTTVDKAVEAVKKRVMECFADDVPAPCWSDMSVDLNRYWGAQTPEESREEVRRQLVEYFTAKGYQAEILHTDMLHIDWGLPKKQEDAKKP